MIAEPVSTLRPGDARVLAAALATLGDEVVDAADAVRIAGIPVLHGRVLDVRIVERNQLHDCSVKLILVAHRRRAALEIAHVSAGVRNDQRALELTGLRRIDAEVGRQLHRATHALRHIDERAIGEHRRVERGVVVVRVRDDRAEILLDQLRMLLHGFGEGQKITPAAERRSLNVVATETLSNTASTATPASRARSCKGTPSFS